MNGSDRRSFYRVRARPGVSCLTVDPGGRPRLLRVHPVDLSASGMSVVAETGLLLNQQLRLSLQVGEPPVALKIDALVRRIEPLHGGRYVCGLAFLDLSADEEQRLVKAVFANEQRNADRHRHVRMTVWEPVTFRTSSGEQAGGRALALSGDDLRIVTRANVTHGERIRLVVEITELGLAIDTDVTATEVEIDSLGVRTCTFQFDELDRVTRGAILQHVMEQERRDLSR
jgi:c-di-GMP-binding flagellar brake protein YcgR